MVSSKHLATTGEIDTRGISKSLLIVQGYGY